MCPLKTGRLWAPWRIRYVALKKKKGCIFCSALKKGAGDYVIYKSRFSFAMLNAFPYNNGHLLVSPKRHVRELSLLKDQEIIDLFRSAEKVRDALCKTLRPQGFNIGINIGRSAGAGVAAHLHIHIVPRWNGDTNFMSALYGTKVISQSLHELRGILRKRLCWTKS